jgi:hypothetical protein
LSSYEDRIVAFKEQIVSIGRQLAELGAKRKAHSLAAAQGDARAIKAIQDCDHLSGELTKQEQTISSAIEVALDADRQEQHAAEAAARLERERAAYLAARAVAAMNSELDLALTQLKDQFVRRSQLLAELAATGAVDSTLVMRLSHKSGPTSAAHHCGLGKFLALEMTPNSAQRPLASTNEVLLTIGEPPSPTDARHIQPRTTARH